MEHSQSEMSDSVTSEIGPWAMVPIWVLSVGLKGAELAVYVSLRSFADRSGGARPHVKTLAERAGVSERTAERALARFRELNLMRTTKRYRDDGSCAGCNYHLMDITPTSMSPGTDAHVATPPTHVSGQEHSKEHTNKDRSVVNTFAHRAKDQAFVDWTIEDLKIFAGKIDGTHVGSDGSCWPEGTYEIGELYRLLRTEPYVGTKIDWPGRLFTVIEDALGVPAWLDAHGFTELTDLDTLLRHLPPGHAGGS